MFSILLVDDDEDLLMVMSDVLADWGLRCVCASGLEAVKAQRGSALACQVAILDVNLGHGRPSGLDVHSWLRAQGFGGRIVFLTGHANSDPLVQAAASNTDSEVVSKPIDANRLLNLAGVS